MSTADLPIVATAIVGVAGIAAGALTAWGQRTQAERLARQSFLRTRRGDAYTEVLTAVRRVTRGIELEAILMQPAGGSPLPSQLEDEVIFHLDALIAVYGSKQVRDLLGCWSQICRSFWEEAQEAKRAPGQIPYPTQAMRTLRANIIASEEALQAVAREDLKQAEEPQQTRSWRRTDGP
jgi:hypothetical protein